MLTERQLLILKIIIDEFIDSAHPVGSRVISKKDGIALSAATIRNEMADLEDLGYLEKTHTSSGRIPSEKGYRYYVDHIIAPTIKRSEINILNSVLQEGYFEVEQIVQKAAEVLSELTNYTAIILGPEIYDTKLKQIQLLPLSAHSAVSILVTDTGHVEHRSFSVPFDMHASDLEKMVNILNDRLSGVPIIHLQEVIRDEVIHLMKQYVNNFEKAYAYLSKVFIQEQPVKVYVGGKSNLLLQPEFRDINKIHSFLSVMEDEQEIAKLMQTSKEGIHVRIGQENDMDAIKDFSLITATYHVYGDQTGTIGLLGPTRMEYRKVITLLNAFSSEMTKALYLMYKNN
ncbi:MAG TPA: heat-inducible transcriptional repressor HrcA [Cerasibacillus sp.]|uniref:heat-inducible transcriptional repressor HrcA n=1 Tax=Cerasibacillus sp. TaxID=2498711 RepID=UPI002F3ED8E3